MKKLILLLVFASILFSCKEGNSESTTAEATPSTDSTTTASTTPAEPKGLNLEGFTNLPIDVAACGCYFSLTEADFANKTFVYTDNDNTAAYISLNGTMTKLEKKSDSSKGGHTIKVFANDQFETVLDINEIGKVDKKRQFTGMLKVNPKNGATIINNVYGECNC